VAILVFKVMGGNCWPRKK